MFNTTQRQTLAAIIDTIIAPITSQSTIDRIVSEKINQPGLENVTAEMLRTFLSSSGTENLPNLVQSIEEALQRNMPVDVSQELGMVSIYSERERCNRVYGKHCS